MSFALITGASRGIGASIALQLAQRKIDLLLVARSGEQLKELAQSLSSQYGIKVYWLSSDMSQPGSPEQIYNWCTQNGYTIKILINNAGYGLSGPFESYRLEEHLQMMQVNMNAIVSLTYLFLPMLKQQPKGYIMNISSSAAYQAVPYLSLYAASKVFVLQFSRGLRQELRKTNVSITCISPGATRTGFDERAQLGPKALKTAAKVQMKPEEVAAIAVKSMFAKKPEVITGFINKAGAFFVWLLPKNLVERTAEGIYK